MPQKPKPAPKAAKLAAKPVKKAPVKKAAKAPAVKPAKAARATAKAAFYLSHTPTGVVLSDKARAAGNEARAFVSFDEARAAGIDALVRTIEAAEEQLHALKRATSYDDWRDAAAE